MLKQKRHFAILFAAFFALLGLVSCGSQPGTEPPSSSSSTGNTAGPSSSVPAPPSSATETSLTIDFKATPESSASQTVLKCNGSSSLAGSTVSNANAACAALEKNGKAVFQPASTPQQCTLQMGGPQTAKVSGTFKGTAVDKEFSQHDGCAIDEWKLLQPLFGSNADNSK